MIRRRKSFVDVSERGDTIVEVLIAIVIVATVLAGAFTVSQKSSAQVQDSQERGEALQLLQGNVEVVRALALAQTDDTSGIFATSPLKYFCINTNNQRVNVSGFVDAPINSDNFNQYNNGGGVNSCKFLTDSRYNVIDWYDAASKTFTFRARWDSITGGKNEERLEYRVYPDN